MKERKIIQIAAGLAFAADNGASQSESSLVALCSDGSVWELSRFYEFLGASWRELPPIPQPEKED